MALTIAGLWRYPVTSLAGEVIDEATLTPHGIPGDRMVYVRGPEVASGGGTGLFDILPLLVATDGAVASFGRDIRRLRPNILIGGVDGMAEREWEGKELHVGTAVIGLHSLRGRCPMTTVDPDLITRDPEVLRDIGARFGGKLALNAWIVRPGVVRVGDAVQLVAPTPVTPIR